MIDQKSREEWFRIKKLFFSTLNSTRFSFLSRLLWTFLLGSRQNLPLNYKLSLVSLSQFLKYVLYWNLRFFSLATNLCSLQTLVLVLQNNFEYLTDVRNSRPLPCRGENTLPWHQQHNKHGGEQAKKERTKWKAEGERGFSTSSDRRFRDIAKALLELVEKYLSEIFAAIHKAVSRHFISYRLSLVCPFVSHTL